MLDHRIGPIQRQEMPCPFPHHASKESIGNRSRLKVMTCTPSSALALSRWQQKVEANGLERLGPSALVLLVPFPDDGQRILDVFLRVGIGAGVKNLSIGRNYIGNAVGEGRAHK